jgi:hypothetical protein
MPTRKLEMHEGPEAWERFRKAMEAIVSLRKEGLPPKRKTVDPKPQARSATEQ